MKQNPDPPELKPYFKCHKAQWLGNALVVAGGFGEQSSEACTINDEIGKLECVDIAPTLTDYHYGVSFAVPSNFCV